MKFNIVAAHTNAAVIRISESKLDETILQSEIQISNYELLRNGGGVACYIRSDIGYLQKHYFPKEIKNIFVKILLPKAKLPKTFL